MRRAIANIVVCTLITVGYAVPLRSQSPLASHACRSGAESIRGVVTDSNGGLLPGATVALDSLPARSSDLRGAFVFSCVEEGKHKVAVSMAGFSPVTRVIMVTSLGAHLDVSLTPFVSVDVEVNGDDDPVQKATSVGPAQVFKGERLRELADDPDDLQRELQQLAAVAGGNPTNSVFTVDGFQDSTKIPPRSSIAYIKLNPDIYSAEYRQPPGGGGRVEIYTKPGQANTHGDLFAVTSGSWMNARNPFSTEDTSLGKERFGVDLSGPVRRKGSGYSLSLEHRNIADAAAINAYTLGSSGSIAHTLSTAPLSQALWIGLARVDWAIGSKNTFMLSYGPWRNNIDNLGVGGTTLEESGYSTAQYDDVLRMFDVTTLSPHLMHAIHASLRFTGERDTPNSTTPQVVVAGAFTGGGSTLGPQRLRERFLELDDDLTISAGHHLIKTGTQTFVLFERPNLTTGFNGSYIFGGGVAPALDANGNPIAGQTEIITGLEQYRRTILSLPGGVPTTFSDVAGNPHVSFTQVSSALYAQDEWNASKDMHVSVGLRYYLQNEPLLTNGITPRVGFSWAPGKSHLVSLHAHYGLFAGRINSDDANELYRMDGSERVTSTIYSPVYGDPLTGNTAIHSLRSVSPSFNNLIQGSGNTGLNVTLKHGWQLTGDITFSHLWNAPRTKNINSPLNGMPLGPRPLAPDLNILQLQSSAHGHGNFEVLTISQNKMTYLKFNVGISRIEQIDDNDGNVFFNPQNSASDEGEFARRSGQGTWHAFGNATLHLPLGIVCSSLINVSGGTPYNVLTGQDNNGDGNFNDRPRYASIDTPGAILTKFGVLVGSGGVGVLPRNIGTMPTNAYMDVNFQREFALNLDTPDRHKGNVIVNVRSSNVLNVTNVTAVGNVLGSPFFGIPYAADNGRRVEAGIRYEF